jgi:hypothetical protein
VAERVQRKRCGAKTRSGTPCQRWAMPNGRCNLHGGKSTGAPGNKNSLKHGIYGTALRDDEKAAWSRIDVDGIDDEIRIAKLQLKRALEEQRKIIDEAGDDVKVGFELSEIKTEAGNSIQGPYQKGSKVKRRPDYRAVIDRLFGRIAQLQQTKSQIPRGEGSPHDAARQIREALDAIEQSTAADAPVDAA